MPPKLPLTDQTRVTQRRALVAKFTIAGYTAANILQLYNESIDPESRVGLETINRDRTHILKEARQRYNDEVDSYRGLLLARAETMWASLAPAIATGNLQAVDRGARVLSLMADLTGANAPVKVDMTVQPQLTEEERLARVRELIGVARARQAAEIIDQESEPVLQLVGPLE